MLVEGEEVFHAGAVGGEIFAAVAAIHGAIQCFFQLGKDRACRCRTGPLFDWPQRCRRADIRLDKRRACPG